MANLNRPLPIKITKTCLTCNGYGMIIIKSPTKCNNCNGDICYMCESNGGCLEPRLRDCNECHGCGNIVKDGNGILSPCRVEVETDDALLRVGHLTSLAE